MKLLYDNAKVTRADYEDVGLTAEGIKLAEKVEPLVIKALQILVDEVEKTEKALGPPGFKVTPHSVNETMKRIVMAVAFNRDLMTAYNKAK